MAHVAKFKASAVGGMVNHYERGSQGVLARDNVDATRSPANYNLGPDREGGSVAFIRERVEGSVRTITATGKERAIRKDAVRMADWVVTMPENVPAAETGRFFEATYKFLEGRYGRDNVVGAWVHLDEARPHMHFSWVPIDEAGKLNAQRVLDRTELRAFHPALQEHLEAALGRPVGILLDDTQAAQKQLSHLGQSEYIQAKETLAELRQEIEEQTAKKALALKRLGASRAKHKTSTEQLAASRARHETLTEQVNALESDCQTLEAVGNALLGGSRIYETEVTPGSGSTRAQEYSDARQQWLKSALNWPDIRKLQDEQNNLRRRIARLGPSWNPSLTPEEKQAQRLENELEQLSEASQDYEDASNELEAALNTW